MTITSPPSAERWFKRILWIGIFANLALAIPTLLMPAMMMQLTNLPAASPLLWPRFAALLLILLSTFYMPAAIDPNRYRLVAWLAVISRLVGFVFFVLLQSSEYHLLGYFDLVFFLPEAVLLWRLPAVGSVPVVTGAGAGR